MASFIKGGGEAVQTDVALCEKLPPKPNNWLCNQNF